MPALITHHLFGERSAALLPEGVITGEEELLAFLLGNQGPDPFFFRTTSPSTAGASRSLAKNMHHENMTEAFNALREGVSHLPKQDAGIGRAFALGMLSHYALDRSAHPLIYAQQYALVEADPSLEESASGVHAVIESDIDTWMLWCLRHATVHDCPPVGELAHTDRICRVAGALTSQVAWAAFGIRMGVTEYAGALADMELCYRTIEPHGSLKNRAIGDAERLARPYSQLVSLSHRVSTSDECWEANLEHKMWKHPFAPETSNDSFMDRFDAALEGWPALAEAFTHGGDELRAAVAGLNYSGVPLDADERCPEELKD
jgi:hypothetical protein